MIVVPDPLVDRELLIINDHQFSEVRKPIFYLKSELLLSVSIRA